MSVNPDMLRLARQRRGFQQVEAARLLGIEQPVLSRLENGISEIREEVLKKAERVYDLPRSFFMQTDPVYGAPVSVHPMWGKKADVSAKEVDAVVAELNFRVMHLRRFFEGVELSNTSDLPRLDIDDYGSPAKVAAVLRAHWGVPRGPIKDLTLLVEKAGVIVVHSAMGGASISGVTFSVPGMPKLVLLNSDQPADRMRFTLAHELGHLVMHRFPSPTMEDEANKFASALLIPSADLKPYISGRRPDLALLAALKPEWRASMQSLLMAITEAAPLSPNQAQYLWKQISARGYRLREPPELDFPREPPSVLGSLIRVHREGLGYSADDLARFLNVHQHELADLYGLASPAPGKPKLTILK
jgi:Zn-dependent peptidase ImmA (M78 family)/transcriptional regulator with XRE-family HTH domain